MSNNSWKQFGGIGKTDNFNTINASTIIADQFISRSSRPTYQFFNGTYEVAFDLSAGVNVLAGNSIYSKKDVFVNRDLYANNKLFFGNSTFLTNGNNFPALPSSNTYAYMYGNSRNIGVNTLFPETAFNITGTVGSVTDILTVESGNEYIYNIIAQNTHKRGIAVDADDISSNILFYNDTSTYNKKLPDARIKYEKGGILTMRSSNRIISSSQTVAFDSAGGQLLMNNERTALKTSGSLSMDSSGNISVKSNSNIVLDISRSKITFNANKSIVVDTSNEFLVNYPSGNLTLNGNGSKIDSVKDVTLVSRGLNNTGGKIILDTRGGSIVMDSKELFLNAKLKFSTVDRPILTYSAYDETITVFDNSHQTFLPNIYKDDSIKYGHSIDFVGLNEIATTFIHMTPANTKLGGTVGGGVAPYDTSRSITMIGTTDISGNYNHSQMTVSGKNTHKYLSTVGINTFQPKTENYVLDVNGAMSIGNGEINEIIRINFEIKHLSIAKAPYSNYGIAVGSPTTSVSSPNPMIQSYQQVLLYTNDGGKTWNQSNVYQLSNTTDDIKTSFYNCFMLDDKYGIISGENAYIFITNDGGISWYRLLLVDQNDIPINTDARMQTVGIANNPSRLIITYSNFDTSSTTGIYFLDISSLSILFASESNKTIRIIPSVSNIGQNVQSNSERTSDGFMITSTSVTNTFSYFAGDGIARYKNAALAANYSYTPQEAYTIKTNEVYYAISALDDNRAIAVGDKKISYTVNGTNWTHKTTMQLGLGYVVLKSVVACDASNAIAIGEQGEVIYSYNWGDSVPVWTFVSDSIINTSGAKKMLLAETGHLQSICMVELSAFIIVNVIVDFQDSLNDRNDIPGKSKILYCYLPNLFNNLNNNVLDVSGSIAITGQVKVYNGELLINTVNSNADNKPAFDARTLNIGSKTHIVNIGFNDDKSIIEEELKQNFDVGRSVINIGVIDPSNSNSSPVLINIGNYNSSKIKRKSNLINIGGGKDITSMGGTVIFNNNAPIASRGKKIVLNDFDFGLNIFTYITENSSIYNDNFLPNAVFLPNVLYFIYDFRRNYTSDIRSYLNNNMTTLIPNYINLKNSPTIIYTPSKLPIGIIGPYSNGNATASYVYDVSKFNTSFESYVLEQYISYYLTTNNIASYTINTATNNVEVSVSGTVTSLDIVYTSYSNYYYPIPFTEGVGGYDVGLETYIINEGEPFRTSIGAGIYVADNTDNQAGHIRVSQDMNGWVMKPTNPNSNAVKFDINNLSLSNNLNINPGLGVHGINSGLVVLNRPSGTDIIDSSYVLSVKQFDISNILVRDSINSTDVEQVIKTNILIGNSLTINNQLYVDNSTILNGDVSLNGKFAVGSDVSLNGKLLVASDVSINGNISIKGTLESTTYQSNYIVNTVTNDYEFIVTTDMSMSGNLFVKGDVSLNSDIDIKGYIAVGKSNPVVSVDISYTDAIRIPTGTTLQRPIFYNELGTLLLKDNVPLAAPSDKNKYIGSIRYNTDNNQFEGFGPAESWSSLGSVSNISQNTTIVAASPNPGSTNNDLIFFTANKNKVLISDKMERMRIDGSGNVGIGTIAPECTFHIDISNNTEDNTTAGLFTNSNLKPIYNVDLENTINNNIGMYIFAYKGARNSTSGYSLSGITGDSISNFAYDYYYRNTDFEDFAITKYMADRDFRTTSPYGTSLYQNSTTVYTYGFDGPYDPLYNQDIETYVSDNIHEILTAKARLLAAASPGDLTLNLSEFMVDSSNGFFTNPSHPGIYVYRSGTSPDIYSYYDFSVKNRFDYDRVKSYLYEGYYNHITNNALKSNIYINGTVFPFGVDSSGSRVRYTFIDNCSVVVGNDNKLSNNAANIIYSYLSNQNNKSALSFGFTKNENKMIIRADGNVGIGTTTPSSMFTVQGDAFVTSRVFITNDVSMNNRLYVANSVSFANNLQVTDNVIFNNRLYVANDASFNNNVDIRGYVAIGKSNPVVALDISSTDAIRVPSGTTAQRPVNILTTDKNKYIGSIRYNIDNQQFEGFGPSNDWSSLNGLANSAQNTKIITSFPTADSSNNDLMFFTAPKGNLLASGAVERMRITASGDVFMNNRLYVLNDVSLNNNLYVNNDVSFNNRLEVSNNVIFKANLLVKSDVSINGVLQVDSSANFSKTITLKKSIFDTDPIGLNIFADVSSNGNLILQKDFITNGDIYCINAKDINLFERTATVTGNTNVTTTYANVINFGRYAREINIMNASTGIGAAAYTKVINIGHTAPSATSPYSDKINITGNTSLNGTTSFNGTDAIFSSGNIIFNSPIIVEDIAIMGSLSLPTSTLTLDSLNLTTKFIIGSVTDPDLDFDKNNFLYIRNGAKLKVDGDIESFYYNKYATSTAKSSKFFHVQSPTRKILINTIDENLTYNIEYMSIDSNYGGSGFNIFAPTQDSYTLPIFTVKGTQVAIGKPPTSSYASRMLDVSGNVYISKNLDISGNIDVTGEMKVTGNSTFTNSTANKYSLVRPVNASLLWNIVPEVNDILAIYATQNGSPQSTNTMEIRNKLNVSGPVSIGRSTAINALDVSGGVAIGATYAGTNAAPTNGLLVQGNVGIGRSTASNALDVSGGGVIGGYATGTRTAPTNGLLVLGNVAIGTVTSSMNALDVSGGIVVGATYAGTNTAPPNGLLVQGRVGIGTSNPSVILDISDTAAIRIPVGTTLQRPTALTESNHGGYIRYNNENHQFEGYGPGDAWGSLGGVINVAQNTKIMASSPAADSTNNELMFFTAPSGNTTKAAAVERMRITSSGDVSMNSRLFIGGSVGIGTSSQLSALGVNGGVAIGATYAGTSTAPTNGLLVQGNVGIGTTTPQSALDVEGGVAIGSAYAGTSTAPTNGLLVQGNVGIGRSTASNALDVSGGGVIGGYASGTRSAPTNGLLVLGNVAVGTVTSSMNTLDVSGGTVIGGSYAGVYTAPTNGVLVQGNVCIGTNAPGTYMLNVNGSVQASSYNATSDIRLKTNIQFLSGSLDLVNQLNGVSFTWKNDTTNKPIHGLIAQDVEKVLPDIVNTATTDNELGYKQKSIHYDGLFPHLIESIKTLTQENKALVAKVDKIMTILEKLNISV
jgi:hypothetical protein